MEEEYETKEETSQTGHPYHRGPDKTVKSQAAKAYEGPSSFNLKKGFVREAATGQWRIRRQLGHLHEDSG